MKASTARSMSQTVFRRGPNPSKPRGALGINEPVGLALTATVSVVAPGTAVEVGLNVQVIPAGNPGQSNVTVPLNPFAELRFNVKLAELSTAIVAEVGDTEAVMVPITSVAGFELVVVPLVPVTVNA